ncbi:hypothetical protein [Anaerorhabdus furcosa]|uniref:Uncharacterized protein n=1 Tax=Anaerorhabdus furcosa TaxID=118967 RepID=A0A1T4M1L6_9FIRM|nr:hypothetical protein [Anaerorhabdus furcosa]SJZ60777.1 hypothetical protein SAMN02745191_1141 [Anaerorhabdus furcosa]
MITNKIRLLVKQLLGQVGQVYSNVASDDSLNYITYRLNQSNRYPNRYDFTLLVDLYFNEIEVVEDKCDEIIELLNYKQHNNNDVGLTFYLESRGIMTDVDKDIQVRSLRFQIIAYERSSYEKGI